MNLLFFEKNVNKQLKSADFLSETLKFRKILLNKVLAFLIQMSDHTLVVVVQPPNSQKPHTSSHVLLFTFIPLRKISRWQIFLQDLPWLLNSLHDLTFLQRIIFFESPMIHLFSGTIFEITAYFLQCKVHIFTVS